MQNAVSDSSVSSVGLTLKGVTPHLLAVAMLQSVMEGDQAWRMTDAAVTSEAHTKFPMACEFYQLRIFLDLLKQRFGAGVSSLVEASLISVLDVQGKYSGMDLFPRVMAAISGARELGPIKDGPDDNRINMDCQVADQCLRIVGESDEEKRRFRLILAESLTSARIWAEQIFPELVAKIEFDPVSVAFVNVETAYKGLTNRWRESPGCFERHLQRMEGNPLFPESVRNPTDDAILLARAKDDDELEQLTHDVGALLFVDLKNFNEQGTIPAGVIIDLMQHRVEPLMVRAAAIGQPPSAQHQLNVLTELMGSMLGSVPVGPDEKDWFRKNWARQTNMFSAQASREDTPIEASNIVLALLCENLQQVKSVLDIYRDLDPGILDNMRTMALAHFEIAELEGFKVPGGKEKLALFVGEAEIVPSVVQAKPRPWWRVWGKASG